LNRIATTHFLQIVQCLFVGGLSDFDQNNLLFLLFKGCLNHCEIPLCYFLFISRKIHNLFFTKRRADFQDSFFSYSWGPNQTVMTSFPFKNSQNFDDLFKNKLWNVILLLKFVCYFILYLNPILYFRDIDTTEFSVLKAIWRLSCHALEYIDIFLLEFSFEGFVPS